LVFLLEARLKIAQFGFEIDTDAKNASGVGKSLCDIPQNALRNVAVIIEERQKRQYDS